MANHQQHYVNSCAAASLLCAARELGVLTMPAHNDYSLWGGNQPLVVNNACERRIYQWTSNNPNGVNAANWGYSMPSDIADCAIHLGLTARILVYSTWTVTGLKIGYRNEYQRIRAHPSYEQRPETSSAHALAANERELKILAEWRNLIGPIKTVGALHTVMVRPNGSVMEPDDGTTKADIAADKLYCGMHGAGISIIVST